MEGAREVRAGLCPGAESVVGVCAAASEEAASHSRLDPV